MNKKSLKYLTFEETTMSRIYVSYHWHPALSAEVQWKTSGEENVENALAAAVKYAGQFVDGKATMNSIGYLVDGNDAGWPVLYVFRTRMGQDLESVLKRNKIRKLRI